MFCDSGLALDPRPSRASARRAWPRMTEFGERGVPCNTHHHGRARVTTAPSWPRRATARGIGGGHPFRPSWPRRRPPTTSIKERDDYVPIDAHHKRHPRARVTTAPSWPRRATARGIGGGHPFRPSWPRSRPPTTSIQERDDYVPIDAHHKRHPRAGVTTAPSWPRRATARGIGGGHPFRSSWPRRRPPTTSIKERDDYVPIDAHHKRHPRAGVTTAPSWPRRATARGIGGGHPFRSSWPRRRPPTTSIKERDDYVPIDAHHKRHPRTRVTTAPSWPRRATARGIGGGHPFRPSWPRRRPPTTSIKERDDYVPIDAHHKRHPRAGVTTAPSWPRRATARGIGGGHPFRSSWPRRRPPTTSIKERDDYVPIDAHHKRHPRTRVTTAPSWPRLANAHEARRRPPIPTVMAAKAATHDKHQRA